MYVINYKGNIVEIPIIANKNDKSYYSYLWESKYNIKIKNKEEFENNELIDSYLKRINKGVK